MATDTGKDAPAEGAGVRDLRYHHGRLARALIDAAHRILERNGSSALSLRAVALEAGVSPAAPYHHFRCKEELLAAVADDGWRLLGDAVRQAGESTAIGSARRGETALAYVRFARDRAALYRLMCHVARDRGHLPPPVGQDDEGYQRLQSAVRDSAGTGDAADRALSAIARWCLLHGLAEMAGFAEFGALRSALGGDEPFVRALLIAMDGR